MNRKILFIVLLVVTGVLYLQGKQYYEIINKNLKTLLKSWPNKEKILGEALSLSQEMLDWRLAGALRIFQYVETKPYLTEEFHYNKIKESFNNISEEIKGQSDWEATKKGFFTTICRVQVKYALGMLMLWAHGTLNRMAVRKNHEISPNLLSFWILLSREMESRSKDNEILWNVYFSDLPTWGMMTREFVEMLDDSGIKTILKKANQEFDKEKNEMNLFISFKSIRP